jgi:cell division cycle 2-like protein
MESYKKRDRSRSPGVAERNDAEPVKIKKRLVKVKRLRTRERSLEDQDRAQGSGPSTVGSPSAGPSKRPEREHESRDSRRSRAEPSTRSRIPSPAPRVVGYSSDEQKEEEMGPVLGPEREPRPFSPPREISSPRRQIPFVSGPSTPPPPRPNPLLGDCRSVFNYTRLNHIADGAYGTVYRAKCNDTGGIYALKKLKLEPQEEAQGYPTISLAEVSAVMVVRDHENIVDVREIVVGDKLTQ